MAVIKPRVSEKDHPAGNPAIPETLKIIKSRWG
jgi:hypothetical protein